jgi:hypothetical protein
MADGDQRRLDLDQGDEMNQIEEKLDRSGAQGEPKRSRFDA